MNRPPAGHYPCCGAATQPASQRNMVPMGAAETDADAGRPGADHQTAPGTGPLVGLLARIAAGDAEAFRQVYDSYVTRLYGIAICITHQPSLASDAVHDAFLEVWNNAGRYDVRRGNPEVWLVTLARYRALDIVRRRAREVSDEGLEERADEEPDALTALSDSADAAALRACMGTLAPDRRKLITLAFIDGLSHSELAARLQMPIGTVKANIRRSLRALRTCLGGEA